MRVVRREGPEVEGLMGAPVRASTEGRMSRALLLAAAVAPRPPVGGQVQIRWARVWGHRGWQAKGCTKKEMNAAQTAVVVAGAARGDACTV